MQKVVTHAKSASHMLHVMTAVAAYVRDPCHLSHIECKSSNESSVACIHGSMLSAEHSTSTRSDRLRR